MVLGSRLFYRGKLQYIRWSYFVLYNRSHKLILK